MRKKVMWGDGDDPTSRSGLPATCPPDSDGDIIPAGATYGGYRVQKVGPRLDKALTTEALVINRRTKTLETFYNTCCSQSNPDFTPGGWPAQPHAGEQRSESQEKSWGCPAQRGFR